MDRVVVSILVLGLAFLLQYLWQVYKAYSLEQVLADMDAPEGLTEHSKEFAEPEVIKVTEGVWVAVGFALANSILLEGPTGIVIVDTTESISVGAQVFSEFRKLSDKPVAAIIYTHHHSDHVNGAESFVSRASPPPIWAHHTTPAQMRRFSTAGIVGYHRAMRQFGTFLKPPSHVNSGIGPRLMCSDDSEMGYIQPTHFLHQEQEDHVMAGINLRLIHLPGETSDQIGVWLPDAEVLMCADDLYRTFPNLYAIRGAPTRDVLTWVKSLDKMRALRPKYLVPSHTQPVEGKEYIEELLTSYRDGIKLVHDQTVRYMNMDKHPDDIAGLIKLPEHQANHPYLQEFYGTLKWSSKAVFSSYLGWFSGAVEELNPLAPRERAQKMVRLAGGEDYLLKEAHRALSDGDHQWALELSSHLCTLDKGNKQALSVRVLACKELARKQTSPNGRNYYLTQIREDLGQISNRMTSTERNVHAMPLSQLFHIMTTRLKAEDVEGLNLCASFNFTDISDIYIVTIRNSVCDYTIVQESVAACDVMVTTTSATWRTLVAKTRSPSAAYASGDIVPETGVLGFWQFMNYFDSELT